MPRNLEWFEKTSLQLAEEWVLENLRRETRDYSIRRGDETAVDGLEQCDCVPTRIDDDGKLWVLWSVERVCRWGKSEHNLRATYEYRG